jgi:two-component system cell cycle response regulator
VSVDGAVVAVVGTDPEAAKALRSAGYDVVEATGLGDLMVVGPGAPVVAVVVGEVRQVALGELGVPVLVVVPSDDAIDDALLRGAHDVVRRPILPKELVARVRAAERLTAARRTLQDASRTDPLTGMATRRHLDEHLDMVASMARRMRRPFSILMIDVDRTRRINDEHGHTAGDTVVAAVARRLAAGLRSEDVAGRWSGEEFLVMLPHTPLDGAWRLADRIRGDVCDVPVALGGGADVLVTVSIGCAEGFGDDIEDHLRRAQAALDEAKAAGRNRVVAAVP